MKRNKFLQLISLGLLGGVTTSATSSEKRYGLVQVKPFTAETITRDIAAEIMALVAWNHLREDRFKDSISIAQQYQYKKPSRYGGGYSISTRPGPGYTQELYGVLLYSSVTKQIVRIFPDGDYTCTLDVDALNKAWPPEYETVIRNTRTGKERIEKRPHSGHGLNQVKVVELYVKLGFYQYKEVAV